MYDDYSYLIHSAKGSSWSKKDHKYVSKTKKNGKWRYAYKIVEKASDNATIRNLKTKYNRWRNGMSPEDISYNYGKYTIGYKDDGKAKSTSKVKYGNQTGGPVTLSDIRGYSDEFYEKYRRNKK